MNLGKDFNHPILNLLKEMKIDLIVLELTSDHLTFRVRILAKPGAKKAKIVISDLGELVLSFSARPVEGAANKEITKILSKIFSISASQISLVKGLKSKQKSFSLSFSFTEHKTIDYYLIKISSNLTRFVL